MYRRSLFALLMKVWGLYALASPPVAIVTSAMPFSIDGYSVNAPGVTSFPLVAGDIIATSQGSAVLIFRDGSIVKLGTHSAAKISSAEAKLKLVLLAGALDYRLAPAANLTITNLNAQRTDAAIEDAKSFTNVLPSVAWPVSHDSKDSWADPRFLVPYARGMGSELLPPLSEHF